MIKFHFTAWCDSCGQKICTVTVQPTSLEDFKKSIRESGWRVYDKGEKTYVLCPTCKEKTKGAKHAAQRSR